MIRQFRFETILSQSKVVLNKTARERAGMNEFGSEHESEKKKMTVSFSKIRISLGLVITSME